MAPRLRTRAPVLRPVFALALATGLLLSGAAVAQAPAPGGPDPGVGALPEVPADAPPLTRDTVERFLAAAHELAARSDSPIKGGDIAALPAPESVIEDYGFDSRSWDIVSRQVMQGYSGATLTETQRQSARDQLAALRDRLRRSDMPRQQQQAMIDQVERRMGFVDPDSDMVNAVGPYVKDLEALFSR